jgi:hypothetical protein
MGPERRNFIHFTTDAGETVFVNLDQVKILKIRQDQCHIVMTENTDLTLPGGAFGANVVHRMRELSTGDLSQTGEGGENEPSPATSKAESPIWDTSKT